MIAALAIAGWLGTSGTPPSCAPYFIPADVAAPRIDGALDDALWEKAALLGDLTQVEPNTGAAPSERTEVLLAYDATTFYVGLRCFDREPQLIRATQMRRDAQLDPDDRVELLIDSFLDRRNAFWFQIGAGRSKGDALVTRNGSAFNKQWDGIWHGDARVTSAGWEAELAIPFATLNFDPSGSAWGFNLRRHIRRHGEEARWASADPKVQFFWISSAGTLTGLSGLHQGLGLDLTPFVVANAGRDHVSNASDGEFDAGIDAFWRMTPSLKLALTLNTDFAETEVDSRRVNLTRFPLFFPEKRAFFLEDSGAFQFGSDDLIPFFTRRIGLDSTGGEVPLTGAAKLTGQSERWSFGLLDAQTDATSSVDGANLFAGHFSQNLFEQSDVGVIATSGDPDGSGAAATYGADLNLRTTDFLGDRTLTLSGFVVASDSDAAGRDLAGATELSYPNDEVRWSVGTAYVGRDFDPKLGFVARTDIRSHAASFEYRPRLHSAIRQLEFQVEAELITDVDGATRTCGLEVQPFGVEFESGDAMRLELEGNREVLTKPFDIQPNVTIAAGDHRFERARFEMETSDKRDWSLVFDVTGGEYWDGYGEQVSTALDWRASAYFLAGAEFERTDARLDDGDFIVHVARLRCTVLTSPRVSWANLVQWDDVSEQIGLNSRLWWILSPGCQAFAVLEQGWLRNGPEFEPTQTDLALKFGYTFRL